VVFAWDPAKAAANLKNHHIDFREAATVFDDPHGAREDSMKKIHSALDNDTRPEYDFASMKGGVRGKYAKRTREGTNIVLLAPEVVEGFPTEDSVNEALRGVLSTTRAVRRGGGLPNKALQPLQPTSRARSASAKSKKRSRTARG
jgi:hypothetical protein